MSKKNHKEEMREIHKIMCEKWVLDVPFENWYSETEELQEESWQDFKDFWFSVLMLALVTCGLSQGLLSDWVHGLMPVAIYILEKVIIE